MPHRWRLPPSQSYPSAPADEGAPRLHERASRLDVGCTVCSPQLAVGATWNVALAHSYGAALGAEFRAKGANVILGPGVNLARVALNGRAAKYISGEEPSLGAAMGSAYVRGVQSQGVAAVVKHFAVNNQETLRTETDVIVSERALWEVYYAAFEACVEAGVASVMVRWRNRSPMPSPLLPSSRRPTAGPFLLHVLPAVPANRG